MSQKFSYSNQRQLNLGFYHAYLKCRTTRARLKACRQWYLQGTAKSYICMVVGEPSIWFHRQGIW